ncbi:hypothetical protein Trydic_g12469 [Trypoxylus dichotomus]
MVFLHTHLESPQDTWPNILQHSEFEGDDSSALPPFRGSVAERSTYVHGTLTRARAYAITFWEVDFSAKAVLDAGEVIAVSRDEKPWDML